MTGHSAAGGWLPPGPAILFCPADRPERFEKAMERADVVILDLEDAVPPGRKTMARDAVRDSGLDPGRAVIRLNQVGSSWFDADLEMIRRTGYRRIMLPKVEGPEHLDEVSEYEALALLETPLGVLRASEIISRPNCISAMWGAEDLVAAMGGVSSRFSVTNRYRDVPRYARAQVALTAAALGRLSIDAVHLDIADLAGQRLEAEDAAALGFAATACIHPSQVPLIREAYLPPPERVAWARRIREAAAAGGVGVVNGLMVDGPMYTQAELILRRAAR